MPSQRYLACNQWLFYKSVNAAHVVQHSNKDRVPMDEQIKADKKCSKKHYLKQQQQQTTTNNDNNSNNNNNNKKDKNCSKEKRNRKRNKRNKSCEVMLLENQKLTS